MKKSSKIILSALASAGVLAAAATAWAYPAGGQPQCAASISLIRIGKG